MLEFYLKHLNVGILEDQSKRLPKMTVSNFIARYIALISYVAAHVETGLALQTL